MTYQEIASMISEFGIPYAYRVFRDEQQLPYCVFYYPNNDDIMADNLNYETVVLLRMEVYTGNKNFELENRIEETLARHDIPFAKIEDYIDSERMYMLTYESEVLIHG